MFVSSSGFACATAVRGDFAYGDAEDVAPEDVAPDNGAPEDAAVDGAPIDSVGAGCMGIDWVASVGFCG
jgi:hypothetical protein